jgi:hypothetical protein
MKRSYLFVDKLVSDGSAVVSLEAPFVKDHEILVARTIAGYHTNQANSEASIFYLTNGSTRVYLDTQLARLANYATGIRGRFIVPTGWAVGVLLPSAANGEYLNLYITGEIYDLNAYREVDLV